MRLPPDRKRTAAPPANYPAAYAWEPARGDVFDPALKHYGDAFVKGPLVSMDRADQLALESETSRALGLIVQTIAGSELRDHLVVRGSVALSRWFEDEGSETELKCALAKALVFTH
jgi:hypothetical protein